jgi:7,8-dihydropterin-6-yl-methyl-4-(beta-D-ribofuranosyl)aminobenzene 5'-phosphate synthase
MQFQITTLSENCAAVGARGLLGEWGLSILVETDNEKILFDTGASISTAHNARILGKDLSKVSKIALSHGHFDHTGGLGDVLRRTGNVEVIAHPDVWSLKYVRYGEYEGYVGIPFRREELETLGASFNLSQEPVQITDEIMTTGVVPMVTDYEEVDPIMFVKEGNTLQPDPLADDLSLIIKTEQGLVVLLGCAHRGIINILRRAQELVPGQPIDTVIGGAHLMFSPPEKVERTIRDLKEIGIRRLGCSHCTGFAPTVRLAQEFGEIFFPNNAGTSITVP